jgi:hypothetical protein
MDNFTILMVGHKQTQFANGHKDKVTGTADACDVATKMHTIVYQRKGWFYLLHVLKDINELLINVKFCENLL